MGSVDDPLIFVCGGVPSVSAGRIRVASRSRRIQAAESDKWEVVGGVMLQGCDVLGSEQDDYRCAFPLILLCCLNKTTIRRVQQGCKGKSIRIGSMIVYIQKRVRFHNNLKSEYLIIE